MLWRLIAVFGAVGLGFAGFASFALGTCHDSGGFCADSFSGTHVFFYAVAVALLSSSAALLARTVTSRAGLIGVIAYSAGLLLLLLIVVVEATLTGFTKQQTVLPLEFASCHHAREACGRSCLTRSAGGRGGTGRRRQVLADTDAARSSPPTARGTAPGPRR